MVVKELTVSQFRNLERARVEFSPGINILSGANAQGKTNLLEALYVCCTGRSHRTHRDAELIRYGEKGAVISVQVEHQDGIHLIDLGLSSQGRKRVRINHSPARRLGELMGHLNGVLFSPEDLYLVKEGPAWRRRFVDITLSQIKPPYFYVLQQYQQALAQRNALLKTILREGKGAETLPVWEAQLAALGARLMAERQAFTGILSQRVTAIHGELTQGRESLTLRYATLSEAREPAELEQALLQALERGRERDLRAGTTLTGPHRDDLILSLGGRDVRSYGSQGQQRTSVLSLKLAELAIMTDMTREAPILLLDDVFSELDTSRRRMLERSIGGVQTLITCVDGERMLMDGSRSVRFMRMEAGRVLPGA